MAFPNVVNFAKVTVSTGYDASAYSIVLNSGEGAKLPTAPFYVTWWNSTDYSDPADDPNREIDQVTAISTDTLTLTNNGTSRTAQQGTTASTKNTAGKTYMMLAGLTASDLQSLFYLINHQMTATGSVNGSNAQFTFTSEPSAIISDGAFYIRGGTGWTWNAGTLTATMAIPPSNELYGLS